MSNKNINNFKLKEINKNIKYKNNKNNINNKNNRKF